MLTTGLRRCIGFRPLSRSCRLLRGPLIDDVILNQLKDDSKIMTNDILILKPKKSNLSDQHKNDLKRRKKSNKINSNNNSNPLINASSLIEDIEFSNTSSYIKLINNLRVGDSKISKAKFDSIKHQLTESFTGDQLRNYIKTYYEDVNYSGKQVGISRKSKLKLATLIMKELWNITITNVVSVDDYLIESVIPLTNTELFLLLSSDGLLIKYLTKIGCKIEFQSKDKRIKFVGTENQINSANIILQSTLKNSYSEEMDMSFVKHLLMLKFNEFNTNKLSTLLGIHFEHISNDTYRLTSLNENQIKKGRRLLLWLLDHNDHIQNYISIPQSTSDHFNFPIREEDSLTWIDKSKSLFRLSHTNPDINNQMVKQQLDKYNNLVTDFDLDFDGAKSFLNRPKLNDQTETESSPDQPIDVDIDNMFNSLTTLHNASGLPKSHHEDPLFVVTFGHLLFENDNKETQNSFIPIAKSLDKSKYLFNSHVPLLNDKVFNLPLFEIPELDVNDINHFRVSDPHKYSVQLKFQPNNTTEFPPIELWVDLNKYLKPEMNSMKLVTVETENNYNLSMPERPFDMKVSHQITGDVFSQPEESLDENFNMEETSIEAILDSTTKMYSKYRSQPGLETFLNKSVLNFNSKRKNLYIHPNMEILIGGQPVDYQFISTSYRRQLDFNYRGRLVQFNLIEGGYLGGRKIEVSMIGDSVDKQGLYQLLKDSINFIF